MSENLFINAQKELERLENLLMLRMKQYSLTMNKDKVAPINGRPARHVYSATLLFTRADGTKGYEAVDGDSFPDLFSKLSNKI